MEQAPASFTEKRNQFFQQITSFFGDVPKSITDEELAALNGQPIPNREYALYQTEKRPNEFYKKVEEATNLCWPIFKKAFEAVKGLSKAEYISLGFPSKTHEFLSFQPLPEISYFSRFDFAEINGELKVLELNADTPFLVMEAFYVNGKVTDVFHEKNPNDGYWKNIQKAYQKAIQDSIDYLGLKRKPLIMFSTLSKEDDIEEYDTVRFLQSLVPDADICGYKDLRLVRDTEGMEDGLYHQDGRKIDIWFHPGYPMDFLVDDVSEDGEAIGLELIDLVKEHQLSIVNPPSAYVLQSKVLMALIWALKESNTYFTEEEMNIIDTYFLPTYLGPQPFLENREGFVRKTIFGREGNSVTIFNEDGVCSTDSKTHTYEKQYPSIYQKYVELPKIVAHTINGDLEQNYILGAFVTNQKYNGVALRLGGKITDGDAYWVALSK